MSGCQRPETVPSGECGLCDVCLDVPTDERKPTPDTFLVARASCGCVETVLLPTDNAEDEATFLRNFPHATRQTVWPQVRCDEHPGGAA